MYRPNHRNVNTARERYERNKISLKDVVQHMKSQQADAGHEFYEYQQPYVKPLYLKMRKHPSRHFDETAMWIEKKYVCNNTNERRLTVGDLVLIHPEVYSTGNTLSVDPVNPKLGIVWYHKKEIFEERYKNNGDVMERVAVPNNKHSLVVKILEGRGVTIEWKSSTGGASVWSPPPSIDSWHTNDEYINDKVFMRLEPVTWWIGNNATVKSHQFKALADILNIDKSVYQDLP